MRLKECKANFCTKTQALTTDKASEEHKICTHTCDIHIRIGWRPLGINWHNMQPLGVLKIQKHCCFASTFYGGNSNGLLHMHGTSLYYSALHYNCDLFCFHNKLLLQPACDMWFGARAKSHNSLSVSKFIFTILPTGLC